MLYMIIFYLGYLFSHDKHAIANPIVGNTIKLAKLDEFPFIASIGRKSNRMKPYRHVCMGSLISLKHVLTSAHCLEDENIRKLQVKVGSVDVKKGKVYTLDSVITYQEWQTQHMAVSFTDNDIVILKLSKEVNETGVEPVSYSKTIQTPDLVNKTVIIAGWGRMMGDRFPRKLRTASLRVLTRQECRNNIRKVLGKHLVPSRTLFCTNARPNVILGDGDSGGPVLLDGEVVGINDSIFPTKVACPWVTDTIMVNRHRAISFYIPFIDFALTL